MAVRVLAWLDRLRASSGGRLGTVYDRLSFCNGELLRSLFPVDQFTLGRQHLCRSADLPFHFDLIDRSVASRDGRSPSQPLMTALEVHISALKISPLLRLSPFPISPPNPRCSTLRPLLLTHLHPDCTLSIAGYPTTFLNLETLARPFQSWDAGMS